MGNAISNIKTGDLIIWTSSKTVFERFIRTFTSNEFTHLGIALVENGVVYVIESKKPYTRKVRLEKSLPFFYIPMNIHITSELHKKLTNLLYREHSIMKHMANKLGIMYNTDDWYGTDLQVEFYNNLLIKVCDIETDKEIYKRLELSYGMTPTEFVHKILEYVSELYNIEHL